MKNIFLPDSRRWWLSTGTILLLFFCIVAFDDCKIEKAIDPNPYLKCLYEGLSEKQANTTDEEELERLNLFLEILYDTTNQPLLEEWQRYQDKKITAKAFNDYYHRSIEWLEAEAEKRLINLPNCKK